MFSTNLTKTHTHTHTHNIIEYLTTVLLATCFLNTASAQTQMNLYSPTLTIGSTTVNWGNPVCLQAADVVQNQPTIHVHVSW